MAKKIAKIIKLQAAAGQATPAGKVGPALGQAGVNIMEFVKAFNSATEDKKGDVLPVVITVYVDKSFTFKVKTVPATVLLKKAANVEKGSSEPNKVKIAEVSWQLCMDIAVKKMSDLNTDDIQMAANMIAGTARSMGIRVIK